MASTKTTRDHDEIRRWAEARGAVPAEVASTHQDKEPGILRFEFPNASNRNDENLREISWEEFFQKFDENNLELLYQDTTAEGAQSNFNQLIHPESEKRPSRKTTSTRTKASGSRASSAKKTTAGGARRSASTKSNGAGRRSAGSGKKTASAKKSTGTGRRAASGAKKGAGKTKSRTTSGRRHGAA